MVDNARFQDRLKLAMDKAKTTPSQLSKAIGVSYQALAKALDGRSKSLNAINNFRAAEELHVNPHWLATGEGTPDWQSPQRLVTGDESASYEVAHMVIHPLNTNSPVITWGDDMKTGLPRRFRVALPDDSMAPKVRAGDMVEMETGVEPRPGDGVLVVDDTGRVHLRVYRVRKPGRWEAHAINDAYQPLDSERDGLQVLAVLTGVHARWG